MRKIFCGIGVFLFLCLLSLGFYGSYKVSDMKLKIRNLQQSLEQQSLETKAAEQRVTQTTKCTIEEYDKNTGSLRERTISAADTLQGMDRTQLAKFLQKSNTAYYRYTLVAFSAQHLVIRQSRTAYGAYYLTEEDGRVVVYRGDRKTLFESTEIALSHLPEYLKREIYRGKLLESEQELYDFLENYSS